MKRLFFDNHETFFVGRVTRLSITSLITALIFMVVIPSLAFGAPPTRKLATVTDGDPQTIAPVLIQDPTCTVFTDTLTAPPTPYTLTTGSAPNCDKVDWTFPVGATDGKTCTFTLDGNFDDNLEIDFYSSRDHTFVNNPSGSQVAEIVVDNSSDDLLQVQGTNIQLAHLNTDDDQGIAISNQDTNLGDIAFDCSGNQ